QRPPIVDGIRLPDRIAALIGIGLAVWTTKITPRLGEAIVKVRLAGIRVVVGDLRRGFGEPASWLKIPAAQLRLSWRPGAVRSLSGRLRGAQRQRAGPGAALPVNADGILGVVQSARFVVGIADESVGRQHQPIRAEYAIVENRREEADGSGNGRHAA